MGVAKHFFFKKWCFYEYPKAMKKTCEKLIINKFYLFIYLFIFYVLIFNF